PEAIRRSQFATGEAVYLLGLSSQERSRGEPVGEVQPVDERQAAHEVHSAHDSHSSGSQPPCSRRPYSHSSESQSLCSRRPYSGQPYKVLPPAWPLPPHDR